MNKNTPFLQRAYLQNYSIDIYELGGRIFRNSIDFYEFFNGFLRLTTAQQMVPY